MLPKRTYIALFTAIYLVVALVFAMQQDNQEFLLYISVVLFVSLLVMLIDRHAHFSLGILWCLSIWGLLHMLGGLWHVPVSWPIQEGSKGVLYSVWILPFLKYDQAVHAFGFGVSAWLCYQWFRSRYHSSGPTVGVLILCGLAGMGLGAFNEIIEFIATLVIPNTNVGGYENTGWDLVSNLVGVTVAAILIRFGHPAKVKIQGLRFI